MIKVLLTGANGQLGRCIQDAVQVTPQIDLTPVNRQTLDVTSKDAVASFFQDHTFDFCINAAAFTDVNGAETKQSEAYTGNAEAAGLLAAACAKYETVLLHVSTDYVFDGSKNSPYLEEDKTNPLNVYGASKLEGEERIRKELEAHFIVRTSWLYSQYGNNFLNNNLRWAAEKRTLTMTTGEMGTPTNANDLAEALLNMILSGSMAYGTYHFSNTGTATWYDFSKAIFTFTNQIDVVNLGKTDHYRTFAKKPAYSVLSKEKFSRTFEIPLKDWKVSLEQLIKQHSLT